MSNFFWPPAAVGTASFPLLASAGSVSAPSYAFESPSNNTGLYLIGTDNMGFAANGVAVGNISSAGAWTWGASGGDQLHVANGRSISVVGSTANSRFLEVNNDDNTAVNSYSALFLSVGGSTSIGDPYINFNVTGASDWTCGVDNSASDVFFIGASATPGTNAYLTISTAGLATVGASSGVQQHVLNGGLTATVPSGDLIVLLNNTGTAAGEDAIFRLNVGGTAAGDAFIRYDVTGGESWAAGVDNSDTDSFVIANSTALGTTNRLRISNAGLVTVSNAFATTPATVASTATITALASTTSAVKLSGSTGTSIQGITAGVDGQIMRVWSTGAAITIANENAGATAANRITTNTGADVVGTAPNAFTLIYDTTASRWILMSSAV